MVRAGYVGLVGLPNSGKSTLLNALIGEKVAIVTPKPQTTRRRVIGLHTTPQAQVCFLDAPGFIRAEKGLNRFLAQEFGEVLEDAEVLVAVLGLDERDHSQLLELVELVRSARKPWIAVITKADLPLGHRVEILKKELAAFGVPIIVGSAEKDPAPLVESILAEATRHLPESPGPLYDPEIYTPHSLKDLAQEFVREKCFLHLHEEVPFGLAVWIRKFDESGPVVRIEADLIVAKESHRAMVIGRGGQKLKAIGQDARLSLEELLGRRVFLGLHVTSRPRWTENPQFLKEYGYGLNAP